MENEFLKEDLMIFQHLDNTLPRPTLEKDHNIQSMRNEKHELSKHQVLESMNSRMTVERVSQLEKE